MKFKFLQALLLISSLLLGVVLSDDNDAFDLSDFSGDFESEDFQEKVHAEWLKRFYPAIELVVQIGPLLNSDYENLTVSVNEKHIKACQTILKDSFLDKMTEETVINPEWPPMHKYQYDVVLHEYLTLLKCKEIVDGVKQTHSFYLKSGIFKIDDEQTCIDDIDNCTNGYLGMFLVQFFKSKIRRLEKNMTDLKRKLCGEEMDYLDALDEKGLLEPNFILNFCQTQARRPRLEQRLILAIETYYGQLSSHELYVSICQDFLLNKNINITELDLSRSHKHVLGDLISGCRKQKEKFGKPFEKMSSRDELFGKIKVYFDGRFNQIDETIRSFKSLISVFKPPASK